MNISNKGIDLIKSFESLKLHAYKALPTEKYYTIGYGHYGSDVKQYMVISEEKAEMYLRADLKTAEDAVNRMMYRRKFELNQNQFDALVSFTYNCGAGNLTTLTQPPRTLDQIGKKLTAYNKSGGKVIRGLVRRRKAEQELYFGKN